jgi:hypothetical protein
MRYAMGVGTVAAVVAILGAAPSPTGQAQTPSAIDKRIAEAEAEGAKHPRVKTPDPYPRKCNVIKPEQVVFPASKPTGPDPYIWSGDFDAVSISFGWDKTYQQAKMPLRVLYPDAIGNGLRIRLIRLDPPGDAPPFSLDGFNARVIGSQEPFFASWPVFPTPGKWMMIMTAGSNWGCFVIDRPVKAQ